ncbi:MAG: DUF202 domain-containing protein [Spirochaetales bacterium]|nr:DUF202 domain-containing protein [Spirochaetales bacterium]
MPSYQYKPKDKPQKRRANPYDKFKESDLILRDQLAIDRTILANERTFLAYCRTALALGLTGTSLLKFLEGVPFDMAGWILIALGVSVAGIGIQRTIAMARNIATARRDPIGHSQGEGPV